MTGKYEEEYKQGITYGGIKVMSVLEPDPGLVGLIRVVSIIVQPSPFAPHPTSR